MTDAPLVTTVLKDKECVTLINTFFTDGPQDQDEIVKILIDITEEVMKHQPGFISATIHRSYDGNAVADYVQWRSAEHWKAALQRPEAQEYTKPLREKYRRETALYQVAHILYADGSIA